MLLRLLLSLNVYASDVSMYTTPDVFITIEVPHEEQELNPECEWLQKPEEILP